MKVQELVRQNQETSLPPLQKAVLRYLETHPDEVFRYRDLNLARALNAKPSALSFSLWALARKGLVRKLRIGRTVWFGCEKAVRQAARLMGTEQRPSEGKDPMEQIRVVREQIKARVGLVDGLALLEESRARR